MKRHSGKIEEKKKNTEGEIDRFFRLEYKRDRDFFFCVKKTRVASK